VSDEIVGDVFTPGNRINGHVIVASPPSWGGPEHRKMSAIGLSDMFMDKVLEVGRTIAPKMLLHLNLDKNDG